MRLAVTVVAAAVLWGQTYGAPRVLSHVQIPRLDESSGVTASRTYPGVFWTHNDSGGGPWIFAFDRSGRNRGRLRVSGAANRDWEDIALGPGPRKETTYLYIGDIGDNAGARKRQLTVYRVPEPQPDPAKNAETAPAEALRFVWPDRPHDAETLMVHPISGDLYIVTKATGNDPETLVFKASAPLRTGPPVTLKRVAALRLPNTSSMTLLVGRPTGGDISPDGKRVVLCDYFQAWEAILPESARSFDDIWTAHWESLNVPGRAQGEGVCYRHDGKALIFTSEGTSFPLVEVELTGAMGSPVNMK